MNDNEPDEVVDDGRGSAARVAVVTGAGRGIGRAIAERLAADGRPVAVNDVDPGAAQVVAERIQANGGQAIAVPADVTDRDAVFGAVAKSVAALGPLGVMVANAGIAQVKPLREVTPDDLHRIFSVNLFGVVYSIQAAAEHFIAQGDGGKIINAASIAGHRGSAHLGHYSATKFGVVSLTQSAARELAPFGITVNAYCPGIVDTDMWDLIDDQLSTRLGIRRGEATARQVSQIALGRMEQPEDVAGLVSYLAGPGSDYMTGQSIVIDGGIVMR